MQKRFKYLAGALLVTALTLVASAVAPHRAAATTCGMIFCTNSGPCNVDACGGVGFCSNHHCVPL